eukprot:m.34310 g.34310  ORF g.34310 m.34310 type:complete len:628 (-) comp16961_c0_seq1:92-1975(-)
MEEVDKIIISQLRQIGTEIPDDINGLEELSTELLVAGCATCINTINNDDKLSTNLPKSMAVRFRVGTELANAVKALGFMSEIGYNTFLYSNVKDSRQILMWLVERLPKEAAAVSSEILDEKALLARAVAKSLSQRAETYWTPSGCKKNGVAWTGSGAATAWFIEGTSSVVDFDATTTLIPNAKVAGMSDDTKRYYKEHLSLVTDQPPLSRNVVASIVQNVAATVAATNAWETEWNTKGIKSGLSEKDYVAQKGRKVQTNMVNQLRAALMRSEAEGKRQADMLQFLDDFADVDTGKGSKFANQEKILFSQDTEVKDANAPKAATEEEIQAKREEEIAELEGKVGEVTGALQGLMAAIDDFSTKNEAMEAEIGQIEETNAEREEQYKVRKEVLDLLPDGEQNVERLKQIVKSSTKRILALSGKWEKRRSELMDTLRKLRRAQGDAEGIAKQQLEKIKALRAEMKNIAEGAKQKDTVIKQLEADYEAVNKHVGRASYTRSTMGIVRNITRQKEDIDKVLQDTRVVQKDISQLSAKLSRVYAETDELIYKNAKKDETSKKAYKYLANLHSTCEGLVRAVEETGSILREIRELEEQIEAEETKKMGDNLKQIATDLKAIKKENAGLVAQLKE